LLPDDIQPFSYQVELIPYLRDSPDPEKEFTFDGHVDIKVRAVRPVSTIVMHASTLTILDLNVTQVRISSKYFQIFNVGTLHIFVKKIIYFCFFYLNAVNSAFCNFKICLIVG